MGFTADEWRVVGRAARAVAAADAAGDPEGRAARFAELKARLDDLVARYGEDPLFCETEADFTPDPQAAADLYARAEELAINRGMRTLSIRLSRARLLVKELGRPAEAQEILMACAAELHGASEKACARWSALLAACAGEQDPPADRAPIPRADRGPDSLSGPLTGFEPPPE